MRLLIDNLDGLGAVDYTDQLSPEAPFEIVRKLNAPSTCSCQLLSGPIAPPKRLGRVVVSRTSDGTVLFTGYLTVEPETVYVGEGSGSSVYRMMVTAESDDWLLDKQGVAAGGESFGLSGSALLTSLTSRVDPVRFATETAGVVLSTGMAQIESRKPWSENAAAIASAAYARYRVMGGQVEIQPLGATTHALATTDESLQQNGLKLRHRRPLVNDVTISGPMEAGGYVTEIFSGDGTTTVFALASAPFRGRTVAREALVYDTFTTTTLNGPIWTVSDPGAHLSLGAAGLVMGGGDGLDGDTMLAAIGDVELAGCLVLEASNVVLNQGKRWCSAWALQRAGQPNGLHRRLRRAAGERDDHGWAAAEWSEGWDAAHICDGAQLRAVDTGVLRADAAASANLPRDGGWGGADVWGRPGCCAHKRGV